MAKKILIAEDEEILSSLLKKKLTQQGYSVSIAKNGVIALEQMRKEKPDLLLLDVIMPQMGGFEVMEKMQEDPALRGIPIIIVSNSGQPVEIDKAKKLGAKDWIIKTEFDPQEVMDKVKKEIG